MIIDFNKTNGGGGGSGSTVSYSPIVSAGTELGRIVIDGTSNSIFAPSGEGDSHYYIVDSLSEVTDPVEGDVAYIKPLSATGYEFELDYMSQDPQLCSTSNPALIVMATETEQVGLEIINDDAGTDDWYLMDGKPGDYVIFTDTADTDNYVIVKVAGLAGTIVRYQVAGFGAASVTTSYTSSTVTVTVPSDDPFMLYTGGVWVSMKNDTDLSNYYTSAQTDTAIAEATSAFTTSAQVETQITAATSAFTTSGDFKTINSQSIIGSGDIVISGGGDDDDDTDFSKEYLTFVPIESGTFKFVGSNSSNLLSYSLDNGTTWSTLPDNTNTDTLAKGQKIMFKASGLTITNANGIGKFSSSGKYKVQGNIMSLVFGDNFSGQTSLSGKNRVFMTLFNGSNKLTKADKLILPATTLSEVCYGEMFRGCTSLTTAPVLPAKTLIKRCYDYMFYGCSSLTTAPALPATTLAEECYTTMFAGCSSLTTAPVLPATTLAQKCYHNMFLNCTSLTTAPELPATTLATSCYYGMFSSTKIAKAPSIPAVNMANSACTYMFQNCTALTVAPELPATTLAQDCYNSMFYGCTSLTTAPELPATTLARSCYQSMFSNCTNLKYIKCLATDKSAYDCTYNWVNGVSATGTFVKDAGTAWGIGNSGIPSNWTQVNAEYNVESQVIQKIWKGTQQEYDALSPNYDNNTFYIIV